MSLTFDLVVVGTGFASSFFLDAYLRRAPGSARVLVLERGRHDTHEWQRRNGRVSSQDPDRLFVNRTPEKPWAQVTGLGGGSKGWWGCTPRFMPADFRLRSTYGVGADWPLSYDDLEEPYCRAERLMSVSGPSSTPYPRSMAYPAPPARFTDPDRILKGAHGELFIQQPSARASVPTPNRPRCCAAGTCMICPVDAKFTILNEMSGIFQDPRVTLVLEAEVETVQTRGGTATGVTYRRGGRETTAGADLVALGAGAIFNPHILFRSGLGHPKLGRGLHEQVSALIVADLDGVDNFQGSTSITGHGYMHYDGEHRRERAACLIETWNVPTLRLERGKWRQRLQLKFIFEILPDDNSHVSFNPEEPSLPETFSTGLPAYTRRSAELLPRLVEQVLKPLPVERWRLPAELERTESHILGTTVMGDDPDVSIIDRHLLHHRIRNLVLLGGGAFPTSSPANPALTISALSLWSAGHLFGGSG